jgi:hypothetical protein
LLAIVADQLIKLATGSSKMGHYSRSKATVAPKEWRDIAKTPNMDK